MVKLEEEDYDKENPTKKPPLGPVTIWIGVFHDHVRPTLAYNAAQDILALLSRHQLTDIDVDFRASIVTRQVGPQLCKPASLLLEPLANVISPLTPALGLRISTTTTPTTQGTMAIYLNMGDSNNSLLGLTCRHVLMGSEEGNLDYVYNPQSHAAHKYVILLGKQAYTEVIESIKFKIRECGTEVEMWNRQIEVLAKGQESTGEDDVAKAMGDRARAEWRVNKAEKMVETLTTLLHDVKTDWRKIPNRVLGPVLCSPPIRVGVGAECFTEDWGVFYIDRNKLGDGFQGNKIHLGAFLIPRFLQSIDLCVISSIQALRCRLDISLGSAAPLEATTIGNSSTPWTFSFHSKALLLNS